MPIGWAIAGAAVAGVAGSVISSNAQSDAANTAANAQEQAAQLQANTSAAIYNATQVQNQPQRVAGSEALAQEASLLGLNPNLDTSGMTSIAQINPQLGAGANGGGLSFVGPGASSITNELNGGTGSSNSLTNYRGQYNYGSPINIGNGQYTAGNTLLEQPQQQVGYVPPATQISQGQNPYGITNTAGTGMMTTQPVQGGIVTAQGYSGGGGGGAGTSAVAPQAVNDQLIRPTTGPIQQPPPTATGGSNSLNPLSGTPNVQNGFGSFSTPYNPSTFYNDPGYQFEMQQQQLALMQAQAASGQLGSSGALKNALQYAQGLASTDYQNAFNRSLASQTQQWNMLQSLTGGAQVAGQNVQQAGNSALQGIGSAASGYGNAVAAGAVGSANAITNAVNGAAGFGSNALNQWIQGSQNPYSPLYGTLGD